MSTAPRRESALSAGSAKEIFLNSLNRCLESEAFIPTFYERFFSCSDEIREKFRNTNFDRQNRMLARSLRLAAGCIAGEPEALAELADRAETHDRDHLDVRPELYEFWLSAIVATAEEFDPRWRSETGEAWNSVLGYVVKHMVRYY